MKRTLKALAHLLMIWICIWVMLICGAVVLAEIDTGNIDQPTCTHRSMT
jgi:hypothetical protein